MIKKLTRGRYKMKIIFDRNEVEEAIKCKLDKMGLKYEDCKITLSQSTATVQIGNVADIEAESNETTENAEDNFSEVSMEDEEPQPAVIGFIKNNLHARQS